MLDTFKWFCYMHGYPYELILLITAIVVISLVVLAVLKAVAYQAIFRKAGENSWNAFVPFKSTYTVTKIAWGKRHKLFFGLHLTCILLGWAFLLLSLFNLGTEFAKVMLCGLAVVALLFQSVRAETFRHLALAFGCSEKFVKKGLVFPISNLYKLAYGQYVFRGN